MTSRYLSISLDTLDTSQYPRYLFIRGTLTFNEYNFYADGVDSTAMKWNRISDEKNYPLAIKLDTPRMKI